MKKIISIEKVSNGFIVTNGNTKRVYDGSPLGFELDQIHQMLYNSKEGDSHTIVIEVDPPVFTSQDHDSIELCGLLWDKENISVGGVEKDGHHYFTWTEAMEAAQKQGKRLPTADEWKALCDLGSTWDEKLEGRWFGGITIRITSGLFFFRLTVIMTMGVHIWTVAVSTGPRRSGWWRTAVRKLMS